MKLSRYVATAPVLVVVILRVLLLFMKPAPTTFSQTFNNLEVLPYFEHCKYVYLDVGTNTGVQIRKFFEPSLFTTKIEDIPPLIQMFRSDFGEDWKRSLPFNRPMGWNVNILTDTACWNS